MLMFACLANVAASGNEADNPLRRFQCGAAFQAIPSQLAFFAEGMLFFHGQRSLLEPFQPYPQRKGIFKERAEYGTATPLAVAKRALPDIQQGRGLYLGLAIERDEQPVKFGGILTRHG